MSSDFSQFLPGNPFLADLAPASWPAGERTESVPLHPAALEDLEQMLHWAGLEPAEASGNGNGQAVLLRAPRAGFGKSHLLARLRWRAEAWENWVTQVHFDPESGVGWRSALFQVLEGWHRPVTGPAEWSKATVLDGLARRIFSVMAAWLIRSGQVPCADAERTAAEVEGGFWEMFDFGDAGRQPMAAWFQENFEMLLTAALPRLQGLTGLSAGELKSWLRALCGYAQGGAEGDPRRLETLHWALRQPVPGEQPQQRPGYGGAGIPGSQWLTAAPESDGFYRQLLTGLCRLAAMCRPLVVMLDHLDGFYTHAGDLLKLGRLVADWRRLSGRTVLVLSVNEDLWANGFQKALPSALEDRLNGWEVSLGGISTVEAESLVRSRLAESRVPPAVAEGFLARLNLSALAGPSYNGMDSNQAPLSPRTVLRHAARQWLEFWKPSGNAGGGAPANWTPPPAAARAVPSPVPRVFPNFPVSSPQPFHESGYPSFPSGPSSAPPAWPPAAWPSPPPTPPAGGQTGWPPVGFQSGGGGVGNPGIDSWGNPLAQPGFAPVYPPAPGHWSWPPPVSPPPVTPAAYTPSPPPPSAAWSLQPPPGFTGRPLPSAPAWTATRQPTGVDVRFHQLRDYLLGIPGLEPDPDRLCRLVKICAQQLAVVHYQEFPLPGSGWKTAVWQSPDGEILFGTEPHGDRAYWSALLAFARHRACLAPGIRLVVFSAAGSPVNLASWLPQDEIVAARARFLQVITLEPLETATLHAADHVLHEAACGALSANPQETFSTLVPYLEFFWIRLMRAGGHGGGTGGPDRR